MKTSDISAFKGKAKDAILAWAYSQIDQMMPGTTHIRVKVMFKNLVSNILARSDHKIDQGIEAAFLMFGDTQGNIDSDTVVDYVCDMLKELPATDYSLGPIEVRVGKGEVLVKIPRSFFSDLIVGNLEGVKITTEDIKQIKNLFN